MKNLILLVVFILSSLFVAAQCRLKSTKDQFNGLITRSSGWESVSGLNGLRLEMLEHSLNNDTTMTLFISVRVSSMTCLGSESKLLIKSGKDIVTLNLSGKIDCESAGGSLIDYSNLEIEDLQFLKQHTIDAIRIHYDEGYDDFPINNKSDYFIRTLKCFETK